MDVIVDVEVDVDDDASLVTADDVVLLDCCDEDVVCLDVDVVD